MDLSALFQQFGFPVALAIALIYWWRRDYSDLVKRVRAIEDERARDLRAYANSYKILAEQVTEALEQNNRVTRQLLDSLGQKVYERPTDRTTPSKHHSAVHPEKHRTPLPFSEEQRA